MNKYRHQGKGKAIYQPVTGEMEPEGNGVLTPAQQKLETDFNKTILVHERESRERGSQCTLPGAKSLIQGKGGRKECHSY